MEKLNIPLSVPNLSKDIVPMIEECIETGWVSTGGRFITEFEEKVANYVGAEKAVGVQSGSAGLHVAYRVMGVEAGDEVICPTATFIATVNPMMYIGALPVFMDCDDTLNMDLEKLEEFLMNNGQWTMDNGQEVLMNKNSGNKIKAICIVHVFGNPIDMVKVMEIAEKYKLKVIEDSAESLGSYYTKDGEKQAHTGTLGDIGVYSFNANKILTTGGGGMVVAKDKNILDKVRFLSVQAKTDPLYFTHDEIGYNYRLTNVASAFGVSQMNQLEGFIENKIKNYNLYKEAIKDIDGLEILPFNEDTRANYWFYSIMVDKDKYGIDRDELLVKLNECGIQSRPLWGLMHDQKPLKKYEAYKIEKARHYVDNLLNIPCSTNLTSEQVGAVVGKLKRFSNV
ncbi:LegC family aminotransferase [Psychrilyobacter atlanticus]|uniref:LegC family aminotransferase n=1 Tax=Psychrilyobacter atlanticus TaxID=271091 RepID=UPI0004287912|nr:LegC family aminotransferase [Psychrilyobacter atlanticus]